MVDWTRVGLYCGVSGPVVAFTSILLAALLDPSFSWTGDALSNIGELPDDRNLTLSLLSDSPEFFVFNGGLVLTGVIGLPFAWLLFDEGETTLERAGAIVFAVALVSVAGVGIFYLPLEMHGPAAVTHFVASALFLVLYGVGAAVDGRTRFGLLTVGLGVGYVGTWIAWWAVLTPFAPGIAIPEFVGAQLFGGWTFGVAAYRLLGDSVPESVRERLGSPERVP